jgi:drug/metabolite transporter (DMT)-like permease
VVAFSISLIVAIWALNFVAAKIGMRYFPAVTLASFRVVLAGIAMIPAYLTLSRVATFAGTAHRDDGREHRFSRRDLWTFFYLGFFGVAINQLCFTLGLRFTSVGHAAVIVGMGPIYTLILAVLFRLESATWRKAIGMLLAFAGVTVLAIENGISIHSGSLLGDAIMMTGSIGFAMYAVLGKRVAAQYDAVTITAFNHFAGAIVILPLAIHQGFALGAASNWRGIPWQGWGVLLYMSVFGSALAYGLYFWLLRYLEASQLSAFTYLLPVVATILGIVWLGERGSGMQIVGGVLALSGVYWVESGRKSLAA